RRQSRTVVGHPPWSHRAGDQAPCVDEIRIREISRNGAIRLKIVLTVELRVRRRRARDRQRERRTGGERTGSHKEILLSRSSSCAAQQVSNIVATPRRHNGAADDR